MRQVCIHTKIMEAPSLGSEPSTGYKKALVHVKVRPLEGQRRAKNQVRKVDRS